MQLFNIKLQKCSNKCQIICYKINIGNQIGCTMKCFH